MRRSVATLALAVVASLFIAPQALAQTTIVTNPLQLIAGGRPHRTSRIGPQRTAVRSRR